ncbi:DUF6193 family natural product biosynthesis protein [Streptomyces parvulus]|uniref:DUF6193 family natural product biosynthesis protein n=1 Tax=Streptomyces parvulus TaxID=146923 RepID=UPI003401514D
MDASDGDIPASEVSRFINPALYPDLVELGGLGAAIAHAADRNGLDLGQVESASSNPRGHLVTARLHSDRGPILIHLGKERRLFSISIEGEVRPWAEGATGDIDDAVGVVGAWRSGVTLRDLKSRFNFMDYDELAQAHESGDPVETQWKLLLREEDRPILQNLLRTLYADPGLRGFFPYLSMGILCLARDISDRRAGEIRIVPGGDGSHRVQSTLSGEEREVPSTDQVLDAVKHLC